MPISDVSQVVTALPDPVLLVGPDERIVARNGRAEQLFGTDITGWHYVTALRQPALLDTIEATLADGGRRNTRFLSRDGNRDTAWDVSVAGIVLDTGHHVLVAFADRSAVEEAGQMRRDFVANVSHELRTPLTALLGFIETLRGSAREDAAARDRFLGIMEQEAGRMHRLVEDLLSLSRVEDEERLRPTAPVDLVEVIREAVTVLGPMARDQGLELRLELPDAPRVIPGDSGQLYQVVSNLVENAIKYGGSGGSVDLALTGPVRETALQCDGLTLSVTDRGEGIAAHHIARLTERFYRIDTHRSRQVGGTGLGLAIVKHIVSRHRGRLRIDSTPGQGSTFAVLLPAE